MEFNATPFVTRTLIPYVHVTCRQYDTKSTIVHTMEPSHSLIIGFISPNPSVTFFWQSEGLAHASSSCHHAVF